MTHLSVLVPFEYNGQVFEPEKSISLRMLPYQQFSGPTEELRKEMEPYITFEDREAEYLCEYKNGHQQCVKKPNGKLIVAKKQYDFFGFIPYKIPPLPDEGLLVYAPFKDIYRTFETFMLKYHQMRRDKNTGRYGIYINLNGLFDQYEIGGRWSELLILKSGVEKGRWMYSNRKYDDRIGNFQNKPGRANIALASDVNWQAMQEETISTKLSLWAAWQECLQIAETRDLTDLESAADDWWEKNRDIRSQYPIRGEHTHLYAAKREMEKRGYSMLSLMEIGDLQNSRDDYLQLVALEPLTAAFIDLDGNWHESGYRDIDGKYHQEFWDFVSNLSDDIGVAVVDIHY